MTTTLSLHAMMLFFKEFGAELKEKMAGQWPRFCQQVRQLDLSGGTDPEAGQNLARQLVALCEQYQQMQPYLQDAPESLANLLMDRGVGQHGQSEYCDVDPNHFVLTDERRQFFTNPDQWVKQFSKAPKS